MWSPFGDSATKLAVRRADPSERLRPFVNCYLQRDAHVDGVVTVEPVMARLSRLLSFISANPTKFGCTARRLGMLARRSSLSGRKPIDAPG
jgi:hypothetical protein